MSFIVASKFFNTSVNLISYHFLDSVEQLHPFFHYLLHFFVSIKLLSASLLFLHDYTGFLLMAQS